MAGTKFAPGHTIKLGKPSPGSGRTPDWLKARCQEIIDKAQVVEFLGSVVAGEDVEQAVGDQGEAIRLPASVRDRLRAAEILLDRGFGKPNQSLDVAVTEQSELAPVPTDLVASLVAAFAGGTSNPVASGTGTPT
jgi:hypothetical protein